MVSNNGVIFAAVPASGQPVVGEHLKVVHRTIDVDAVELAEGDILVRNLYLSLDPYMRGRMRPAHIKSHHTPAFPLGEVIQGLGVSEVVKSRNPAAYKVGDVVVGVVGWEEYTRIPAANISPSNMTSPQVIPGARTAKYPLSYHLGIFGMPGLTAYVSMDKIAKPKPGETIFVSAAAGAVGQVVCQIAKIKGLRVIGSAGTDEKVKFLLDELKIDGAFNYKKTDTNKALTELCPKGIDIYYDNVGGETLEIALNHLNVLGRVPCSGMISQYGNAEPYGVKNLTNIMVKRLLLQGFIVTDHWNEYKDEFFRNMHEWYEAGKLKCTEHVTTGVEKSGEAFVGMMEGDNLGKAVVMVARL